ncbi:MAG: hypothetical protein JWM31_2378 [Solirubrobacterales bacterium]|nr:hypothetical protein [Solirubrobacterales bacterium]
MSLSARWSSFRESRLCVGAVRVHPQMRVRRHGDGALEVAERLELGIQWDGIPFHPGHVWVAGRLVARDFRIFNGAQVGVNAGAELILGSGYANVGLSLACFERIEIGEGAAIGEQVMIRDSDNHQILGSGPATAPIVVGDLVWIGARATILKGVTIGDGAVVAAGAVVNRDVPAGALVAGVPARVKRTDVRWDDL